MGVLTTWIMRLTRRNSIIGLGTAAAGAGIISGTGAFDSVTADRSFEVSVGGDEGALLGLSVENQTIAGTEEGGAGDNDIIYFELDSDETAGDNPSLNENATTIFREVIRATNNGSNDVSLEINTGDATGIAFRPNGEDSPDLTAGSYDLDTGNSVLLDLYIDTTEGGYTQPDDPYQFTFVANSN